MWNFDTTQPLPEIDEFCSAACVDIEAPVRISGYDDLSKVPLLPKFRQVLYLSIEIDTLSDLRGMEAVDIIGSLRLEGSAAFYGNAPQREFTSLKGLTDEHVPGLTLRLTNSRVNLADSPIKSVDSVTIEQVGVESLDLSSLRPQSLTASSNQALKHIVFGDRPMSFVSLSGNTSLSELTWPAGLTVSRNVHIEANEALSTCLANDFARSTDAGTRRVEETIVRNGPCP